jgi:hypothetical protein
MAGPMADRPGRGGIIQRVEVARVAGRMVAVLKARVPGETIHLFMEGGAEGGLAWLDGDARERARAIVRAGEGAEPPWRARAIGGRIVQVGARALRIERDGDAMSVALGARGELVEADDADAGGDVAADANARLDRLAGAALGDARTALVRAIEKARPKVARRIEAVEGDLARIARADEVATRARMFVAEASRAPRGATKLSVIDWSTGEARTVELPLDPARSARDQLDAIFKRARRLTDGARFGRVRLEGAEATRAELERVAKAAAAAADLAALAKLAAEARAAAPKEFSLAPPASPGRRAREAPRPPHRTFLAERGERILVGRGGEHNDALTFHVAKPHDLWLHAKNRAGAHVIVPLAKSGECPADLLVDAAHLAAHFSEARDETAVEIQYTPRRYLRKPRGSAAGFVVVDREKVLVLRREESRLRRLLEREEA